MKIAVVTEFSPAYKHIADVTLPALERYAAKHDYELCVIHIPDWDFHYRKIEWMVEKMKTNVDVIFYLDCDAMVTNMNVKVESFLDNEHDLFITADSMGINGGSLIIKNSDMGRWVIELILSLRGKFNNEQEVIEHLMLSPDFNQWVKILQHPSINSYPYQYYPEFKDMKHEDGNWEEGDFVVHTPALPLNQRAEVLKNTTIVE